jgi:membrane-associated phospholipid phosphatase
MRWACALVVVSMACTGTASADTIQTIGDVGEIAMPVASLLVTLGHQDGKGTLQLAESYVTAMAVTQVLKVSINRTRPNGGSQSFPSGHTTSAFASAGFLQMRYGWGWGVPAYAAAAFVGYSRVESKQHYTTDVIAGGAIGVGANLIFTRRWKNVAITPTAGVRGVGVTADIRW